MITLLHNPRCGKSRTGLQLIQNSPHEVNIRKYLDEPLTKEEIISILKKLNMSAIDIVRTNEKIWKEEFKNKTITTDELIDILVKCPILIERPIAIYGDTAVIGRPPENILTLI